MFGVLDEFYRLPPPGRKERKATPKPKRASVNERARRLARSGTYGGVDEVELTLGRSLDEETRAEVARLCVAATGRMWAR